MQNKATPQFRSRKARESADVKSRKQANRCMKCFKPVDWSLNTDSKAWVAYDHAKDTPHRCKG